MLLLQPKTISSDKIEQKLVRVLNELTRYMYDNEFVLPHKFQYGICTPCPKN